MDKLPPNLPPDLPSRTPATAYSQTTKARVPNSTPVSPSTAASRTQNLQALEQLKQALQQQHSVTLQVKSSQILSHDEQQQLQKLNPETAKQVLPSTTTLQRNNSGNTERTLSTLYLVKLSHMSVNTLQQGLTTVTTNPLRTGDKIDVVLNSQQQLVIKPSTTTVRHAIMAHLRQALPQQNTISQLSNLIQQVQQLPMNIKQVLLSPEINTVLTELSQSIPDVNKPVAPAIIKSLLQNSGLFLENSLQQGKPTPQDLQTLLGKLQHQLKDTSMLPTVKGDTPSISANHIAKSLENLLSLLLSPQAETTAQTHKTDTPTMRHLNSLLQLLGIKFTAQAGTVEEALPHTQQLKEKLQAQLQQLIQGAQDKIRLNQLRSLANETPGSDTSNNRQLSLHVELPLRWGDQILPLQLQLQEQIEERQKHSSEHNDLEQEDHKTLTKRWQVFLSFDLPSYSNETQALHTQLTLVDNRVSAVLWAESHTLYETTKTQLAYLQDSFTANGLEVGDLDCFEGRPPLENFSSDSSLMASLTQDYHLVDINT